MAGGDSSELGDTERRLLAAALPGHDTGDVLGRGTWGVVVACRHRGLERDVAVKLLAPELVAQPGARERFVSEARILASLHHPHVVPVYDFVERDGACLLVMERLTGGSLGELHRRRHLDAPSACGAVVTACTGLAHAHDAGVLHRDVKPDNLLLARDATVKVADFGIAKVVGGTLSATVEGEVLGSPAYMAPEQLTASTLTPATDVYGAATVLYELLAGRLPFPLDGDAFAVAYRHVHEDAVGLEIVAPSIPATVAQSVTRALARLPGTRPQSASTFAAEIADGARAAWGDDWWDRSSVPVPAAARAEVRAARRIRGVAAPDPEPDSDPDGATPSTPAALRPARSRRRAPAFLGGLVAVAVVAGSAWFVFGRDDGDGARGQTVPLAATAWTTALGDAVVGTPAAAGDAVLVGADDGTVRSLDASDGSLRWSYVTGGPVRGSPAAVGDLAVVGSFDGTVHAVDVATGESAWQTDVGGPVFASPAITADRVAVVAGAATVLDLADGGRGWTTPLPEAAVSSPAVADGLVVFGADDGRVRALALADGRERWSVPLGDPVWSSPAIAGGVVYVGGLDGRVRALALDDGTVRWEARVADEIRSSPVVVGDVVVIGGDDAVVAVDRTDGRERWRLPTGTRVDSRLSVVDGVVVVGDNDGVVHGVEPATGEAIWQAPTDGPVLGGAVGVGGLVVIGSGDGLVRALRPPER